MKFGMNEFDLDEILYKVDSKGKIRTFQVEVQDNSYRMITGLEDGKQVKSKWTTCEAKNVGRANATTPEEQAILEAQARITKKLGEHYYKTREEALATPDSFFKVMLATEINKVKPQPGYPMIADPKLDGMRLVENFSYSLSRRGKPVPAAQWVHSELLEFLSKNPNITLDGELYNHDFREDFNSLMSIARRDKMDSEQQKRAKTQLQFHIYDMFDSNNPNMTAIERKQMLESYDIYSDRIRRVSYVVIHNEKDLEAVKGKHLTDGYEGTIVRTYDSIYEQKRSKNLLKIKQFITEEYSITDITSGIGNRSDIAGRVLVDVSGVSVACGIRGSWDYSRNLLISRDDLLGKKATIRHFGKTEDGSLRFPVCIDIDRPD